MNYFPFLIETANGRKNREKNIIELHNTAVRSQKLLRSHPTRTDVALIEIKNFNKTDG